MQLMNDEPDAEPVIESAISSLYAAYAESDPVARNELLGQAVTDDVGHWTRSGSTTTREALSDAIGESLDENKGRPQKLEGEIQTFRNVARASWSLDGRGRMNFISGEAYYELAEDGRLQQIVNFSDPPHERLVTAGPKAYVDAWNSDTEEERLAALAGKWAPDARWVELRFDHHGVEAIASHMRPVIYLEPLDGVMDVMQFDGAGRQVRLQVEVTKRDGDVIGTFTDFVAINAEGEVTRLAGFKGASLSLSHKTSKVDPDWNWSYVSGYADPNGAFAGGSEVMHLTTHNGKLYAANGYWEDNHWKVPNGRPKQSAQVLRLDSCDATWTVELDMGVESPPDIHFMKGNILKEITVTRDADGNKLDEPADLLFMAAGNIYSHVSVWVLNDESGKWAQEIVASGEPVKNMRYVPRDVEIFTDKVTGQERIFLLLGNPGIISGVYDPDRPTKFHWDQEKEYPPGGGMIDVRALGMVEANGVLYFSGGASIYKRHDGPNPTYSEIINFSDLLDEEAGGLNVEMGGIRGLSAIKNPSGQGESLIFMWAPSSNSLGVIKRMDFDDQGEFTVHDEVVIGDLIPPLLGDHLTVKKVLGAYNNFYELTDPESGETVHIFGFQTILDGNDSILGQGHYYKGGPYAIRTADQRYRLGVINGAFEPGKAHPLGPRTFALSPFGDDHLYTAGYDSNFVESTGKAWIFDASLDVFLAPLRE